MTRRPHDELTRCCITAGQVARYEVPISPIVYRRVLADLRQVFHQSLTPDDNCTDLESPELWLLSRLQFQ